MKRIIPLLLLLLPAGVQAQASSGWPLSVSAGVGLQRCGHCTGGSSGLTGGVTVLHQSDGVVGWGLAANGWFGQLERKDGSTGSDITITLTPLLRWQQSALALTAGAGLGMTGNEAGLGAVVGAAATLGASIDLLHGERATLAPFAQLITVRPSGTHVNVLQLGAAVRFH